MAITALYAALLAPLFILLSVRVIRARRGAKAAIGDGGSADLLRRIRVQGNFAEYVPMALILIGLAESLDAPAVILHALGLSLLAGRASHAYGVSKTNETFAFRIVGMGLTLTVLGVAAATCLALAIGPAFTPAGV